MSKDKLGPGRPTKFNENLSLKILELAQKGKTDEQIAELLDISRSTLSLWKTKDPVFSVTLKEAKNAADGLVEASLFQNAVTGNVTAQIFWLKNRRPEEWRDKIHTELTGADGKPIEPVTVNLILPDNGRSAKKGND